MEIGSRVQRTACGPRLDHGGARGRLYARAGRERPRGVARAVIGADLAAARAVVAGAGTQADRIASASTAIEELARAAQQIAAAAEHQTSALGETASGIAGLDAGIAVLSEHGAGLADAARTGADRAGADAVAQSREGMRRLHDASNAWSASIDALVRRSIDAAAIVRTIEAIADQSNLLALSAAIEAARAGEHGRGFAVVADEVHKLAERSANATREVGDILGGMQSETEAATHAIQRAGASMNDNVRIAEMTGAALDDVAKRADDMRPASQRITSAIGSVSSAVEENAAAAAQMRTTTHEITNVMIPIAHDSERQSEAAATAASATGELAVGIGEIDAATRSLRDQARALDRLVARFTFANDTQAETDRRLPRFPLEQHALAR